MLWSSDLGSAAAAVYFLCIFCVRTQRDTTDATFFSRAIKYWGHKTICWRPDRLQKSHTVAWWESESQRGRAGGQASECGVTDSVTSGLTDGAGTRRSKQWTAAAAAAAACSRRFKKQTAGQSCKILFFFLLHLSLARVKKQTKKPQSNRSEKLSWNTNRFWTWQFAFQMSEAVLMCCFSRLKVEAQEERPVFYRHREVLCRPFTLPPPDTLHDLTQRWTIRVSSSEMLCNGGTVDMYCPDEVWGHREREQIFEKERKCGHLIWVVNALTRTTGA